MKSVKSIKKRIFKIIFSELIRYIEMSNREYDYLFKLVIIGNSGVGKSSVLLRFADDQFNESYITTIGVDFRFKTLPMEGKNVKLQIWDTAGQERFRTITNAYYKGADAVVIVYDTTEQKSFNEIESFWLNEVESYADKNVELLLLGNKCDLDSRKQVNTDSVQEYATARKMEYFETSAKTSEAVQLISIFLDIKCFLNDNQKTHCEERCVDQCQKKLKKEVKKRGMLFTQLNLKGSTSNSSQKQSTQESVDEFSEQQQKPQKVTLQQGEIKKEQCAC